MSDQNATPPVNGPIKGPHIHKAIAYPILLLVLIPVCYFVVITYIENPNPKWGRQDTPSAKVSNSQLDGSVYQVVKYLKANLTDADSYESIEWGPVVKVDMPNWKSTVRHRYRAKNRFGSYTIQNQLFYLDASGNVVKTMDWK
jgi:hypothetical protein